MQRNICTNLQAKCNLHVNRIPLLGPQPWSKWLPCKFYGFHRRYDTGMIQTPRSYVTTPLANTTFESTHNTSCFSEIHFTCFTNLGKDVFLFCILNVYVVLCFLHRVFSIFSWKGKNDIQTIVWNIVLSAKYVEIKRLHLLCECCCALFLHIFVRLNPPCVTKFNVFTISEWNWYAVVYRRC